MTTPTNVVIAILIIDDSITSKTKFVERDEKDTMSDSMNGHESNQQLFEKLFWPSFSIDLDLGYCDNIPS